MEKVEFAMRQLNRLRPDELDDPSGFVKSIHMDTYAIENGSISLPFLPDGIYIYISGSDFNDGVHKYPADDLTDETFYGAVWRLRLPLAFLDVVKLADDWDAKNGAKAESPYTSESFGGYSYSKDTSIIDNGKPAWWNRFSGAFSQWRKI